MTKVTRPLMILAATALLSGTAFAGQAQQNTGCGLGTMIFAGKADNSVVLQVLQATTNGTSGNQTFGISSGTLGCDQPSKLAANERLMEFLTANLDSVARDMAMGQGESLDTVAELMGVSDSARPALYASLQNNFSLVFASGEETSATVLDRMVSLN